MRVRGSVATVCVLLVAASFASSAFAQDPAPPRRVKNVEPVYPEEARLARIEGDVVVEATIDFTGKVTAVEVLQSIPVLDKAALDAVRQWEYTPTFVNGVALPVIMTVTVQFTLTSESPAGNDALDGSLRSDVEKLLAIVGATQMVSQAAGLLSESFLSGLKKSQPAISDRALEIAREVLDSELAKALVGPESLMEQLISMYAKHFSREEVRGLLDFYRTALGQKAIALMPVLAQEGAASGEQWAERQMPRIATALESRLRAEGFVK